MASQKTPETKIIVVRRRSGGHQHGHKGGSWKVAYADFVTAMMAFFMVMWILGMDESVRSAIESYFANPIGHQQAYSSGSSPISSGSSPASVNTAPLRLIGRSYEQAYLRGVGDRIRERLRESGIENMGARVEVVLADDGLRIELVESGDGETFFPFGSAQVKPAARRALEVVAAELQEGARRVVVEGHTDAVPYGSPGYSNWELSADRANAARRVLERAGLADGQVVEVRGYADRMLRHPADPLDRSNRRTSILLPFLTPPDPAPAPAAL